MNAPIQYLFPEPASTAGRIVAAVDPGAALNAVTDQTVANSGDVSGLNHGQCLSYSISTDASADCEVDFIAKGTFLGHPVEERVSVGPGVATVQGTMPFDTVTSVTTERTAGTVDAADRVTVNSGHGLAVPVRIKATSDVEGVVSRANFDLATTGFAAEAGTVTIADTTRGFASWNATTNDPDGDYVFLMTIRSTYGI